MQEIQTTPSTHPHPILALVSLLLGVFFFLTLGMGLTLLLLNAYGYGVDELTTLLHAHSGQQERNIFRASVLLQHLSMFVLPALVVGYIIYKQNWLYALSLRPMTNGYNAGLGISIMLAAIPLVGFSSWLNMQVELPEWAQLLEDQTQDTIMYMLQTDHLYELFLNIFIVAVIPAIGEELVFRGFLQKRLTELMYSPQLAIWVAAFIFSTIHFQFEGFLPRFILGALLGYLLHWSKSLWVPIIAHFFFNASQVVAQYAYGDSHPDMDIENMSNMDFPVWVMSIGVAISVGLIWYLSRKFKPEQ